MEKIIKTSIASIDFDNIRKYFENSLTKRIAALDADDFSSLEWYADCTLDDYFTEVPELWSDEGERLGEGFDMIFAKIILNDETREDLENIFEEAREKEYNKAAENFANREWELCKDDTPYDDDDPRSYNFEKWCEDGEFGSYFLDSETGVKIHKIWETAEHKQAINVFFDDNIIYRY